MNENEAPDESGAAVIGSFRRLGRWGQVADAGFRGAIPLPTSNMTSAGRAPDRGLALQRSCTHFMPTKPLRDMKRSALSPKRQTAAGQALARRAPRAVLAEIQRYNSEGNFSYTVLREDRTTAGHTIQADRKKDR